MLCNASVCMLMLRSEVSFYEDRCVQRSFSSLLLHCIDLFRVTWLFAYFSSSCTHPRYNSTSWKPAANGQTPFSASGVLSVPYLVPGSYDYDNGAFVVFIHNKFVVGPSHRHVSEHWRLDTFKNRLPATRRELELSIPSDLPDHGGRT
jgi:hypothetical protein